MKPITKNDFVPRVYAWTKVSRYALTQDGTLLRYDGLLQDGFPVYSCLFEGYWEPTEVGVGISEISEARSVPDDEAEKIIRREEKPRSTRPKEREQWIHC